MIKLNKQGMMMVEASIIYPIIVGSMVALICIVISIYMAGTLKAGMNYELRSMAMQEGNTGASNIAMKNNFFDKYAQAGFSENIQTWKGHIGLEKVIYGKVDKEYFMRGIFKKSTRREHKSRVYVIDEGEHIRRIDMLKYETEERNDETEDGKKKLEGFD